jgi:MOSC domain-containing protein YiiM
MRGGRIDIGAQVSSRTGHVKTGGLTVNGNAALSETVSGRIVGLHHKPREGRARGIPKGPVSRLSITSEGVEGDFNRWRTEKAAGDPDQAVLLLEEETLAALRAEGWPVQPGDLGENLLVTGLPSGALQAGSRLRIGEVVLELSKPCDPCVVLYALPYVGIDRGPAFVRALKGRRGWFARVLRGGTIGREMLVEPI